VRRDRGPPDSRHLALLTARRTAARPAPRPPPRGGGRSPPGAPRRPPGRALRHRPRSRGGASPRRSARCAAAPAPTGRGCPWRPAPAPPPPPGERPPAARPARAHGAESGQAGPRGESDPNSPLGFPVRPADTRSRRGKINTFDRKVPGPGAATPKVQPRRKIPSKILAISAGKPHHLRLSGPPEHAAARGRESDACQRPAEPGSRGVPGRDRRGEGGPSAVKIAACGPRRQRGETRFPRAVSESTSEAHRARIR
jgi:hypothetical protein